jgi:hypothetical protein
MVGDLQHEYKLSLIQQFTPSESHETVKYRVHRKWIWCNFLCDFEHENTATQGINTGGRKWNVLYYIINKHAFPKTYQ